MSKRPHSGAFAKAAMDRFDSDDDETEAGTAIDSIVAKRLLSIIERIENLEEEKVAITADIKDIYQEAKSAGFDVPVIRTIVKLRKMEPAAVEEHEMLLDMYRRALGM